MARPPLLKPDEIDAGLAKLPEWRREGDALLRDYRFASFSEAMAFMAAAAGEAERLDHHPDWRNSYRTVHVRLTTHRAADGAGLTGLDFALAGAMEEVAKGLEAS